MKTNLTLISFLERIYKAKKNNWKVDWKALLEVQIEVNRLEKENRILREMVESSNVRNIRMEQKVRSANSLLLKKQNDVDVLQQNLKSLKEELNSLSENLEI